MIVQRHQKMPEDWPRPHAFGRRQPRGAVWAALVCTLWSIATDARPSPVVFVGAVGSREVETEVVRTVRDVIGDAVLAQDGVDLSAAPRATPPPPRGAQAIERLLADSRGRFLEGDFQGALAQASEGLRRFEASFAFREGDAHWRLWPELMLLCALAEGRLLRPEANQTFAALATVRPDYIPDPGLTPPKIVSAYQQIRDATVRRKTDLHVTSEPSGAEVLLDGRLVGVTPMTVADVTEGVHFVTARMEGFESGERVEVTRATAALTIAIVDIPLSRAQKLRTRFEPGLDEVELVDAARTFGDHVWLARVVEIQGERWILLGDFQGGTLAEVFALSAGPDLASLELTLNGLLTSTATAHKEAARRVGHLKGGARASFLGALPDYDVVAAPEDLSSTWWVVGATATAIVLVGAATIGLTLVNMPPNPGGTDILVDASNL